MTGITSANSGGNTLRFTVDDRTILCAGVEMPSCRRDVFDVNTGVRTRAKLLEEIEDCSVLEEYFESEFEMAIYDEDPIARRVDANGGDWRDWVLKGSVSEHKQRIEDWLQGDLDPDDVPSSLTPVGSALNYFNSLDAALVRKLGVVIIEGEYPGSSYYAAELRVPLKEADESAKQLGLPIEFSEQP